MAGTRTAVRPTAEQIDISAWKRFRADPADWFSPDEIAKARAYSTPSRRFMRAARIAALVTEILVVVTHVVPNAIDALDVSNWVVGIALAVVVITGIDLVHQVPFTAHRELVFDKKWEFSTQTTKGFVTDALKGIAINVVMLSLISIPVWAAMRATDLWWLWGFALLTLFQIGFLAIWPVWIAPIFNKFKPLEDQALRDEMLGLAKEVGVPVKDVLVSDASKRDRRDNAYFAGLGRTRQLVLFDTILDRPRNQLRSVVAHELGHWKLRHLVTTLPLAILMTFLSFAALGQLLQWDWLLDLAGVDHIGDPGGFPLFWLVFGSINRIPGFFTTALSRVHEREADLFALETTNDPDSFIGAMRSLHVDNLVNLTPSWWLRFTRGHPYADERMAMATEWASRKGIELQPAE